jgi:hypothetical protein
MRKLEKKSLMNLPAASHGVSMNDKFNLIAASCGGLNPADFAISTPHFIIICVICEICGLTEEPWHALHYNFRKKNWLLETK